MTKPFDPELYEADDNAKYEVITWLKQLGYPAIVNPDPYGIDLIAELPERTVGWEVEIKHGWKSRRFPFPTIHIADRKRKFAQENNYFLMLNDPRSELLAITSQTVINAPTVTKSTIYTKSEGFIEVQVADCRFFTLR